MPIRNDTFTGTLGWACILAVVAMGLLLGGCPQPEGGGGTDTYRVTFEADGGTPVPEVQTVAQGGKATAPAAMAKENYAFGGWYKEPALTTPWDFAADVVTGNISLYAKWIPTYTVTFEANGGTPVPAAQTVAEGGKAAAPAAMTKENNAFGGWFREPALTTRWNFAADTVTGDITLYGKWEPLSGGNKAVTWELNGGGWSGGTMPENQVTNGGKIRRPDDPVKDGFTFGGWYKEPGLNGRWVFGTDTVTADITLYAKWEPVRTVVTRTVTFNANGGMPAPKQQTVAQGGKVTEPPAMNKGRLTFGGWFREPGLTTPWVFGTDTVTTNITLYARWTATVTFEANGGTLAPDVQTVTEGGKVMAPDPMTKTGLTPGGWYKEPGLINEWVFATVVVTEDITLYAKWTATVTFVANGGMPAQETQTVAEGDKAEPPAITKANHSSGWYKEPGLINEWVFATDEVTGNITLYARWTYNFTTGAEYRTTVLLTGGTITGDAAYGNLFPNGRTVTLSPFSIANYETTYELWSEVYQWATNGNGYTFANAGQEGHDGTIGALPTDEAKKEPVTTISWRDAVVWCNAYSEMSGKEPVYYMDDFHTEVLKSSSSADSAKMKTAANGYRLPTEAEWEYAARGGGTPPFVASFAYKYAGTNDDGSLGTYVWYNSTATGTTHPVGALAANNAQLYDMSGNVWEWCWDWYGSVSAEMVIDPVGPSSGAARVSRGGSWSDGASACAVALRRSFTPGSRGNFLGFRVVVCP